MTDEAFHTAFSYECAILDQFCYRQRNAHRRGAYFQHLNKVKAKCRLIDLRSIDQPILSNDPSNNQTINQSLDQLRDLLHSIYTATKLLYQLVEQTYFMPFAVTGSAILARIHHFITDLFCRLIKNQSNTQSSTGTVLETLRRAASLYPASNQLLETINQSIEQSLDDQYIGEALSVIDARPVFDMIDDSLNQALDQSIDDMFDQSIHNSFKPTSKSPPPSSTRPLIQVNQSFKQSTNRSISPVDNIPTIDDEESDQQSVIQTVKQSVISPQLLQTVANQSVKQPNTHSVNQSNNRSERPVGDIISDSEVDEAAADHDMSIDQSFDDSLDESVGQSVDQSIESADESNDQSDEDAGPCVPLFMMKRPVKQQVGSLLKQSNNQSIKTSNKSSIKPLANQTVKQSSKPSLKPSVDQTFKPTKRPIVSISENDNEQPAKKLKTNQSLTQSTVHSNKQSVNQTKLLTKLSAKPVTQSVNKSSNNQSSTTQSVKQSNKQSTTKTLNKPQSKPKRSPSPQSDFDEIDAIFGS